MTGINKAVAGFNLILKAIHADERINNTQITRNSRRNVPGNKKTATKGQRNAAVKAVSIVNKMIGL